MAICLGLPDGTIVEAILRKEAVTGHYKSIVEWRMVDTIGDEELSLVRRIITSSDLAAAFTIAVENYHSFLGKAAPER